MNIPTDNPFTLVNELDKCEPTLLFAFGRLVKGLDLHDKFMGGLAFSDQNGFYSIVMVPKDDHMIVVRTKGTDGELSEEIAKTAFLFDKLIQLYRINQ